MSAGAAQHPVFCADPSDCFSKVELDGVTALFHRPSGQTHLLAEPAPAVLTALAAAGAGGLTVDGLCMAFNLPADDTLRGALALQLADLEAAGLVWQP